MAVSNEPFAPLQAKQRIRCSSKSESDSEVHTGKDSPATGLRRSHRLTRTKRSNLESESPEDSVKNLDHDRSLVDALREFRRKGMFCDVALCTREGATVPVHGAVLAACSPHLASLLSDTHGVSDASDIDEGTNSEAAFFEVVRHPFMISNMDSTASKTGINVTLASETNAAVGPDVTLIPGRTRIKHDANDVSERDTSVRLKPSRDGTTVLSDTVSVASRDTLFSPRFIDFTFYDTETTMKIVKFFYTGLLEDLDSPALTTALRALGVAFTIKHPESKLSEEQLLGRKKVVGKRVGKVKEAEFAEEPESLKEEDASLFEAVKLACKTDGSPSDVNGFETPNHEGFGNNDNEEAISEEFKEESNPIDESFSTSYDLPIELAPDSLITVTDSDLDDSHWLDDKYEPKSVTRAPRKLGKRLLGGEGGVVNANRVKEGLSEGSATKRKYTKKKGAVNGKVEKPLVECDICSLSLPSRAQFHRHRLTHFHAPLDPPLNESGAIDETGGSADTNKIVGDGGFVCMVCARHFPLRESLRRHLHKHFAAAKIAQSRRLVGGSPPPAPLLKLHSAEGVINVPPPRHTPVDERAKRHQCGICGHRFLQRNRLQAHMNAHTGARPHMCDTCGWRFNDVNELNKHKRRHRGDKRHVCSVCSKSFYTTQAVSMHMRTHTGERPFQCATCGARFTQLNSLNYHLLIHTGERPFDCAQCGKTFRRATRLHLHARTEHGGPDGTGIKPFECQTCGRGFSLRSYLTQHEQSVHGSPGTMARCRRRRRKKAEEVESFGEEELLGEGLEVVLTEEV